MAAPQPVPVIPLPPEVLDIIIYGIVPCGPSMFSYSQLDGVRLREVMGKGKVIGFTVEGDSMAGEGIQPGDFIICDYEAEPRKGSSVVVRSDHNEYMCKMWDGKHLQSVRESVLEEVAPDRDWSFVAVVEGVIRSSKKIAREHKRVLKIQEENTQLQLRVAMLQETVNTLLSENLGRAKRDR